MFRSLFCLSLLLCFSVPLFASESLTLNTDEVVRLVLEKNFAIKRTELQTKIAEENLRETKSLFDTNLSAEAFHNVDTSARASTFFGDRTDTTAWDVSLTRKIPTGTTTELSFTNQRQKTFGAAAIGGVPIISTTPLYEPTLSFSVTQSLVQNALGLDDRRQVEMAKRAYESADFHTKHAVQQVIFRSLVNFWNLFFAQQHYDALAESVKASSSFFSTTREKRKLGTAQSTDVLSSEAIFLRREGELLSAERERARFEEALRADLEIGPDVVLHLQDGPQKLLPPDKEFNDLLKDAFEHRNDYLAARKDLEHSEVKLKMENLSRWPRLDLTETLALNEIDPSYSSAVQSMDHTNWTVGVSLQLPLENRAARAGARRAKAEVARALFAMKDLELGIENGVTRAYKDVSSHQEVVMKLTRAQELERAKLRAEFHKYTQGRSSAEMIIRFQDDLLEAERRAIEARRRYIES